MMLANDEPMDYAKLAKNYSSAAQIYHKIGQPHQSIHLCKKVFQLEERGLVPPHSSASSHSTMALIYGQQGKFDRQIQ